MGVGYWKRYRRRKAAIKVRSLKEDMSSLQATVGGWTVVRNLKNWITYGDLDESDES